MAQTGMENNIAGFSMAVRKLIFRAMRTPSIACYQGEKCYLIFKYHGQKYIAF
jgi:hypothetical protein